jgi:hypothetical protein
MKPQSVSVFWYDFCPYSSPDFWIFEMNEYVYRFNLSVKVKVKVNCPCARHEGVGKEKILLHALLTSSPREQWRHGDVQDMSHLFLVTEILQLYLLYSKWHFCLSRIILFKHPSLSFLLTTPRRCMPIGSQPLSFRNSNYFNKIPHVVFLRTILFYQSTLVRFAYSITYSALIQYVILNHSSTHSSYKIVTCTQICSVIATCQTYWVTRRLQLQATN